MGTKIYRQDYFEIVLDIYGMLKHKFNVFSTKKTEMHLNEIMYVERQ